MCYSFLARSREYPPKTMLLSQSRPTPLRDDHARFYAASVICGLEYMQDRNLMWRCALHSQWPGHETLHQEQHCTACLTLKILQQTRKS